MPVSVECAALQQRARERAAAGPVPGGALHYQGPEVSRRFAAAPVPCSVTVFLLVTPFAVPMMFDPVCSTSALLPLPIVIARPAGVALAQDRHRLHRGVAVQRGADGGNDLGSRICCCVLHRCREALLYAPVVDSAPAIVDGLLPPRIHAARDRCWNVEIRAVLIKALLALPMPSRACTPAVIRLIGTWRVAFELLLMLIVIAVSRHAHRRRRWVALIVALAALVKPLPVAVGQHRTTRGYIPLPAPPLSDSVPLSVMVLFCWTLRMGDGMSADARSTDEAPCRTLIAMPRCQPRPLRRVSLFRR